MGYKRKWNTMSLGSLRNEATRLLKLLDGFKLLDELSEQDPLDQVKMDETEAEYIACEAEIKNQETNQAAATGANSGKPTGTVKNEDIEAKAEKSLETQQLKNMVNIITTDVPKFTSAVCVHGWLNTLEAYYNLYVKQSGKSKTTFETHFVQSAMAKIQPDYLNAMVNGEKQIRSFDEMKRYLKENHSSKLSIYQVLDTVWDLQKLDVENLRDYGHRLDDKAIEAKGIIEAIFDNTMAASDDGKKLTAEGVFKLVSGQVFLQYLKTKERNVYNHIVNDLDSTWSAAEIALKAMSYSDRLKPDESEYQAPSLKATFSATVKDKKSDVICRDYLSDECKFGNKCKFKHNEGLKRHVMSLLDSTKEGANASLGKKSGDHKKNVRFDDQGESGQSHHVQLNNNNDDSSDTDDSSGTDDGGVPFSNYHGRVDVVPLPTQKGFY